MSEHANGFFGFVAGLYAAVVLAPAVTAAVALAVTSDAAALFGTLLVSLAVIAAGVGWIARRPGVAVRVGGSWWSWLAPVLPFGYVAMLLASLVVDGVPGVVFGVSMLGLVAGAFVGLGFTTAGHNRHARASLDGSRETARFSAPSPERDRRIALGTTALLVVVGILGFGASLYRPLASYRWLFHLMVGVGAGIYGTTTRRTVVVSEAGLSAERPVHRRLRPWSDFESYSVADDALVVHRGRFSPLGLRDVRCDATEIEDVEAVADALSEFLPERT